MASYSKRAFIGGASAALITGIGVLLAGNVSGYEAKSLLNASLPGVNSLCQTVAITSSTILALLLTLISLSNSSEQTIKHRFYNDVKLLAKVDASLFVAAIVFFQLSNLPVTEAENVEGSWFNTIYYISIGAASLLSGVLIAVILMLYNTVASMIEVVGKNNEEHEYAAKDEN